MKPSTITVENEGWTKEERNIILLKNIPAGKMFRHVDFKNNQNEIYIHMGVHANTPSVFGNERSYYDFVHVGNIIDGEVNLFHEDDITYKEVSSHAGEVYNCILIPVKQP